MKIPTPSTNYLQDLLVDKTKPVFELLLFLLASIFVFSNGLSLKLVNGSDQFLQYLGVPAAWFVALLVIFWLMYYVI